MQSKYESEKIITLTEARKKFGYTSDHLGYLARQGFIWAQRQGRIW